MGDAWRRVMMGLVVAALALAWLGFDAVQRAGADRDTMTAVVGGVGAGILALWMVFARLARHFRDLERLRGELAAWRGHAGHGGVRGLLEQGFPWEQGHDDELGRLAGAVGELVRRERRSGGRGEGTLAMVAAALEEPVLLLNDVGRIVLANAPATRLFGAGAAAGMDVHDLLDRPALFRAIEAARDAGQPVGAVLRRHDGAELPARVADLGLQVGAAVVFPLRPADVRGLLPAGAGKRAAAVPQSFHDGDTLAALPMVALWLAVAGPVAGPVEGPEPGRVVGVGTVRLSGGRVFRTVSLDLRIDPGEPLPEAALAPLGLTAAQLAGGRPFADAWPVIAEALHHCVVVGLGVEAALAALNGELARLGLEPVAPPCLDLGRLAAALRPDLAGRDLPQLAAAFGVEHHAGPAGTPHALLAAELAAVLVPRLAEHGILTLGEARALMRTDAATP